LQLWRRFTTMSTDTPEPTERPPALQNISLTRSEDGERIEWEPWVLVGLEKGYSWLECREFRNLESVWVVVLNSQGHTLC